jgi:hypothetical protein
MPRVIQPGGGGGKMRVSYTACRKHGLVAASKRMQAEGMTLGRYRHISCVLPPPAEKLIHNPLRKTKPPRHPPAVSAQTPSSYVCLSCCPRLQPVGAFDLDCPDEKCRQSHPPPPQRILPIFPLERRATAPSPDRPSPHPGAHLLIVMFLRLATGRSDQIRPRGHNLMMP